MNYTFLVLILLVALIPGCMIGPQYTPPQVTVPRAYNYAQDPQAKIDLTSWWRVFEDECLTSLIEHAVCNNYDLRIAVERINEVKALYGIKRAKLFPEGDGIIETNRRHFSQNLTQFEFLTQNQRTLDFLRFGLEVLWEIDLWGRIRRGMKAAYAEYEAQIEDARGVFILLVSNVATTYIDIRTLEKKIQLREERIALDEELLELQKDRFTSGIDSNILLQQTITELAQSRNFLAMLAILYAQTKNALSVLLGELPEKEIDCQGLLQVPQAHIQLQAGLPSELLRRRPDIRRAERLLAASTERVGEAITDLFPRFSLLGSVSTASSDPRTWFSAGSLNWFIGSTGRWPLINFGRITYNIEAKKSVQRQALLAYCQQVVQAFADVEDALVAYFTERERVVFLEEKLRAVYQERDLIRGRYEAGIDDQSSYLLIEKTRVEFEEQLTDAQRAMSFALVSVYKALGGGWDEGGCDVQNCP